MRLRVLAVGTRMPAWVDAGVADYSRRLGPELGFRIEPIRPGQRRPGEPPDRAIAEEGKRLLAAVGARDFVVALDVRGRSLSSKHLAAWLGERLQDGRDLAFLIGGPDGLAPECLERSELRLSLSSLTLPHALVRIVLAEQVYRGMGILKGHPYHRS